MAYPSPDTTTRDLPPLQNPLASPLVLVDGVLPKYLPFSSYDSVVFTLDCKPATFYHLYLPCYYELKDIDS